MSLRQLFRLLCDFEQVAVATGWNPGQQITRVRIWPSWHPLITGRPRRVALVDVTPEQLGIEFDYVVRRSAVARKYNGRLP